MTNDNHKPAPWAHDVAAIELAALKIIGQATLIKHGLIQRDYGVQFNMHEIERLAEEVRQAAANLDALIVKLLSPDDSEWRAP